MDAGLPLLIRVAGTGLVLAPTPPMPGGTGPRLPRVLHWGADPGPLDADQLAATVDSLTPGVGHNALDVPPEFTLLPAEGDGWAGQPGLAGHRDGTDVFPRFTLDRLDVAEDAGATAVTIDASDADLGLGLRTRLRVEASGLLRIRHEVTNTGAGTYTVDGVTALLPVPAVAVDVVDLTGRWGRERSPQRTSLGFGARMRQSRRGRTGQDAPLLFAVGTEGFGFRDGQVWAAHVAWSGNHVHAAERLHGGAGSGGDVALGGGELLLPGEVRLAPEQSYRTPWVFFAWSDGGIDGVSARFHHHLRARKAHPRRPRPLTLNSWQAVYFEHGMQRLAPLVDAAAAVGVERFVVDDGWFAGRRDDTAGLGDWYVDPAVWPDGLRPLADRVHEAGMEFGLWVEPEMANPDSDLVREHPDWLLAAPGRWPPLNRNQLVVDVAHPDAHAYLLERLDALVGEIGVDYLKWDHNRDLLESVHGAAPGRPGTAGVHTQTEAVYRLLDELRERHPGLEIESCSSGGARADLGVLEHTDRIWASDVIDPVERQPIQRWTTTVIPPELVGTHVEEPTSHTTGRVSHLDFRCLTALFGHAGIEWDITTCTDGELARLSAWAGLYKELRGLLHSGDVVRADPLDGTWVHGVVSPDRSEAVFAYLRLETSPMSVGGRFRLPSLDPAATYRLRRREEVGPSGLGGRMQPPWWAQGEVTATGAVLEQVGVAAPLLQPAQGILLHLTPR